MTMKCHTFAKPISYAIFLASAFSGASLLGLDDCERCQYCVEGKCTPNRQTFGHYQTSWRRWPIEAAEVVAPEKGGTRTDPSVGPGIEVPAPDSETDLAPEFPHLKKKANLSAPAAVPTKAPPPTPSEMDTTVPPATELPDQDGSFDPFSDDAKAAPPGDARRIRTRTPQATRTSRLGMGWIVDSPEARHASFVQEMPADEFAGDESPVAAHNVRAFEDHAANGAADPFVDPNPLRIREPSGKPNSLRGEYEKAPARMVPAAAPIPSASRNPLRSRG